MLMAAGSHPLSEMPFVPVSKADTKAAPPHQVALLAYTTENPGARIAPGFCKISVSWISTYLSFLRAEGW